MCITLSSAQSTDTSQISLHFDKEPFHSSGRPRERVCWAYQVGQRVGWVKNIAFTQTWYLKKSIKMLQVPRTCLAPPLEQGICLRKIQLYFLRTTKKVTKTSTCVTLAASVPALLFLSTSPALPSSHPALVCIKTFFQGFSVWSSFINHSDVLQCLVFTSKLPLSLPFSYPHYQKPRTLFWYHMSSVLSCFLNTFQERN